MKKKKLKEVKIINSCGCCHSILKFKTYERALETIKEVPYEFYGNATIVDDTGKTFEDLDLFYGISKIIKDRNKRKIA